MSGVDTEGEVQNHGEGVQEAGPQEKAPDAGEAPAVRFLPQDEVSRHQEKEGDGQPGQDAGQEKVGLQTDGGQGGNVDGDDEEGRQKPKPIQTAEIFFMRHNRPSIP